MKVVEVTQGHLEYIETDRGEYPLYRRYGDGEWENMMGESWETVYDTEQLEALYQEYKMRRS